MSKHLLACYPDAHDKLLELGGHVCPLQCVCFYGLLFKFTNCFLVLQTTNILVKVTSISFVNNLKKFYLKSLLEHKNCELSSVNIKCGVCFSKLLPDFIDLCKSIGIHSPFIVKKVYKELHSFLVDQFNKCSQH